MNDTLQKRKGLTPRMCVLFGLEPKVVLCYYLKASFPYVPVRGFTAGTLKIGFV